MGTFGAVTICVPRARLATPEGGTTEWRNASLPAYQRLTRRAEALIAINQPPTAVTTKPFDTRRGEMAPQASR